MNTLEPSSLEVLDGGSLRVQLGNVMRELFEPQIEPVFLLEQVSAEDGDISYAGRFPMRFDRERFHELLQDARFQSADPDQVDVDDTRVTLRWANLDIELIDFNGNNGNNGNASAMLISVHDGNQDLPEVADPLLRQDVYDIAASVITIVNVQEPESANNVLMTLRLQALGLDADREFT